MSQYLNVLLIFAWLIWLFIGGRFGWFLRDVQAKREADEWEVADAREDAQREAALAKFDVRSKKRDAKTGRFTSRKPLPPPGRKVPFDEAREMIIKEDGDLLQRLAKSDTHGSE